MPSDRKQISARMPPDWDDRRLDALAVRVSAALGIRVSRTDLLFAGLKKLEETYPPPNGRKAREPEGDDA